MIPPSLHSAELSTAMDWQAAPVVIPQEMADWPGDDRPALAGVSSFGVTGTNAHAILGEHLDDRPSAPDQDGRHRLLTISARGPAALRALASSYLDYLQSGGAGHGIPLRDICYSASQRRTHHDSRLTAVGTAHDEIAGKLRSYLDGEPAAGLGVAVDVIEEAARIVFVFPGQGSQWAGMGRGLLAASPAFRAAIDECDRAVRAVAGWSPVDRLRDEATPLDGIDVIQPALWAMEIGLAALWRSWGIDPDVVVGHSMGEVAAACVAGVLSPADGAAVICRRSALLKRVAGRGAMVSVELSADECAPLLAEYDDRISIAASNSPGSTVLSGDPDALDTLVKSLEDRDIFCRRVKVDVASHSRQMDPLHDELLASLESIEPCPGDTPFFSTVLGERVKGECLDAGYWAANLREPVRFGAAVRALLAAGPAYFVELSPHPILIPAINEALTAPGVRGLAIGSSRRDEPEQATLLDGIAALYRAGHPVPWEKLHEPEARFVRLPGYPWQRRRFWYDGTDAPGRPPPGPALPPDTGDSPGPLLGMDSQSAGGPDRVMLPPRRDRASVEAYLVARVAEVLGLPERRVSLRRPLDRQGLDSLMALEVRTRVRRELGVLLPVTRMLGGRDIAGIATEVYDELEGHEE
jgi:acyl transferase domain-containing protein